MNVQITGPSGAGKTYLGKALSKRIGSNFIDTDDILWIWDKNVQPYTLSIDDKKACLILEEILNCNESTVASGMFYPWSESLIEKFDLLIILDTDNEIRRKRIIDREYKMFGNRFKEGGDMYKQFNEFLEWSMNYDFSCDELGSRKATNLWIEKFKCPVIYIDGGKELNENLDYILNYINEIMI